MIKDKQASIIFVLGQAQNIILPSLLEQIDDEIVKVFTVYPMEVKSNVKIVNIKPSSIKGMILMLLEVWRTVRELKKCSRMKLYAPHILNFLANKLYSKFSSKCELYYLFDGILNYRNVSANSGNILKYQKKQAVKSWLVLHKYKYLSGEMVDQGLLGVAGLCVPSGVLLDKLTFSLPIHVLQSSISKFVPRQRILVLEPPLNGGEVGIFENKLIDLIVDKYPLFDVFIKCHPSMSKSNLNLEVFKNREINVKYIDEPRPAELIYQELQCAAVISTNSSALLMIKVNFPGSEVYSIGINTSYAEPSLVEIDSIMLGAGVIFI